MHNSHMPDLPDSSNMILNLFAHELGCFSQSFAMGVHLDESELADLEPQIHKIFKKELGFFDNSTFTSTMATIHSGVEREGLEGHLKDELGESKKVIKLSEEVHKSPWKQFCTVTPTSIFSGLGHSRGVLPVETGAGR